MFDSVNPRVKFPEMEDQVTAFWKKQDIFRKSVDQRSSDNKYVFYDGPPFITGLPHYGHLLGSIAKDVIPRYQTMLGKKVERIWGWDCHGLPIENKVEKALGINNRREIESFGIQKFIDECYAYTRNTSAEWQWYIDKIGRWVDMDHSYKTMDQDYMESVINVFKNLYDKELIYEGTRTSLFCTRCGTPVSNFEIAMDNSYTDMEDPAITIKFPVTTKGEFEGVNILAWTTTPWTMPSNRALVVDKDGDYVQVKVDYKLDEPRKGAICIIYDPKKEQFLVVNHASLKHIKAKMFVQGGKESEDTNTEQTALRESTEETGYTDLEIMTKLGTNKYQWRDANTIRTKEYDVFLLELKTGKQQKRQLEKYEDFECEWIAKDKFTESLFIDSNIEFAKLALEALAGKPITQMDWVDNDGDLVKADFSEQYILGKERVEEVMVDYGYENKPINYEIVKELKGKDIVGLVYKAPYDYVPGNENDFKVYHYDGMANADEGVGIVHSAPGYGEIDTEMGRENGLTMMMNVDDEGKFIKRIEKFQGKHVKAADKFIIDNLFSRRILFKLEKITHRYPFCYRCETPLIHKAQPSWFIDVNRIKGKLLEHNENINWVPEHLKHGRFAKGIETAPDWGVSRSRYWATPMPVWQSSKDGELQERVVIGSRDELREKAEQPITKIIFVRHGDFDKNQGINAPLSDKGKQQAQDLVAKFENEKIDMIISSSMDRCQETIKPLAQKLGIEVMVDERFGSEARKDFFNSTKEKHNIASLRRSNEDTLQELFQDYLSQDSKAISDIERQYQGKCILVLTHAHIIASIRHATEGGNFIDYLKGSVSEGSSFNLYMHDQKLMDLHRPKIDNITIKGQHGSLTRVPEVLDVWMDSGSMPYASTHYPFENKQEFEANYPADFIVEYIGQTRAWFYVMHVLSGALFDAPSFKNVITTGIMAGTDGRKMSKSYGNYPDPTDVLVNYGAEALRLYLMSSRIMVGEDMNFDENGLKDQLKTILLPLWNCFSFFITYANIHNFEPDEELLNDQTPEYLLENQLDAWLIALFEQTNKETREQFDKYNIPAAIRTFAPFIDNLSKWYIRRSRDRFSEGSKESLATMYHILVKFIKLIAPVIPFVTEEMYQTLVSSQFSQAPESIHLTLIPEVQTAVLTKNLQLLTDMAVVREAVSLGQAIRVTEGIKVRQPLNNITIKLEEGEISDWMEQLILEELNIKQLMHKEIDEDQIQQSNGKITVSIDTVISEQLKQEGLIRELIRTIQSERKKQKLDIGDQIELSIAVDNDELKDAIDNFQAELLQGISASEIHMAKDRTVLSPVKFNKDDLFIAIKKI